MSKQLNGKQAKFKEQLEPLGPGSGIFGGAGPHAQPEHVEAVEAEEVPKCSMGWEYNLPTLVFLVHVAIFHLSCR